MNDQNEIVDEVMVSLMKAPKKLHHRGHGGNKLSWRRIDYE